MRVLAVLSVMFLNSLSFAASPKEIQLFDGESLFGLKVEGDVSVKEGVLLLNSVPGKPATLSLTSPLPVNGEWSIEIAPGSNSSGYLMIKDLSDTNLPMPAVMLADSKEPIRLVSEVFGGKWKWLGKTVDIGHPLSSVQVTVLPRNGKSLSIKRLSFTPAGGESLFNGKDLSGWTLYKGEPKREQSKYDVTAAGELRVINGPGDLRTDKAFADFFLQFQCKTNGKNLNSGVFFRCIPEQYQNGYEAQIQNAYKDNDRTKPTDFGTGAIYRRIASRKVVSNDEEWFTMTVLAVGPRIRTWVNGYPTVDWLDDRKANDNPRQGLRTAAGHLSIQGHDPTTNILFKDFQIHDLKK
jgi:hypothetical protein